MGESEEKVHTTYCSKCSSSSIDPQPQDDQGRRNKDQMQACMYLLSLLTILLFSVESFQPVPSQTEDLSNIYLCKLVQQLMKLHQFVMDVMPSDYSVFLRRKGGLSKVPSFNPQKDPNKGYSSSMCILTFSRE